MAWADDDIDALIGRGVCPVQNSTTRRSWFVHVANATTTTTNGDDGTQ
jgi:hypothetical protein